MASMRIAYSAICGCTGWVDTLLTGETCKYMTGHTSTGTHVSVDGCHIALDSQSQASAQHVQHAHTSPAVYSGDDAGTAAAGSNYAAAAVETVETHIGGTHSDHTHHVATCTGTRHGSKRKRREKLHNVHSAWLMRMDLCSCLGPMGPDNGTNNSGTWTT